MNATKFSVPSSDGIHTLSGVVYLPKSEAKGFLHIVHGMTEHIGRYDKFMTDMAHEGYICFGYDNLGHGYTVNDESELGFIAPKGGYKLLAQDVGLFSDAVIKEYGSKTRMLPYYLLGHSMGSFITRYAVAKYVTPKKFIIMGTGGKNPLARIGLGVIKLIKLFKGEKHISNFVYNMAFASYNKPFVGGTPDDPSPWLTRDINQREKYYADKFCTFRFTVSAMEDLIRLNKITNEKSWYNSVPKNLPILLVSGDMDPVGDYGNGVKQVADILKGMGIKASCILYKNARHEILNDSTYNQVKEDIIKFLNL